jgi:nucleotide-binding universal stress UspA family protein
MEKKILVALDDSDNALRSVNYLAENFNTKSRITLLSIIQDTASLCDLNSPELTPYFKSQQSNFCLLEDKKKELITVALAKAKDILLKAGFDEKNIEIKTHMKKRGIARDIIDESQRGYDLLVMGRRGISGIREFFLGSVSHKVFTLSKDISVLIIN